MKAEVLKQAAVCTSSLSVGMSVDATGVTWELQELKPLALSDTEEHAKKRLGTHGAVTHHWG